METKRCVECREVKPVKYFGVDNHIKSGRLCRCFECMRERNRQRYVENKQQMTGYQRQYYAEHKDPLLARMRDKYATKKQRNPIAHRFGTMKKNAAKRGKPFAFTLESFKEWYASQERKCHYCGIHEAELKGEHKLNKSLQVDRKDNELGYCPDNCCLACRRCNCIKSDILTEAEMHEFIRLLRKRNAKHEDLAPFTFIA